MLSREDTLSRFFLLARTHTLDDVVNALPEPRKSELIAYLRNTFDDDRSADEFFWLSSSGNEPTGSRALIAVARDWLRRQPD